MSMYSNLENDATVGRLRDALLDVQASLGLPQLVALLTIGLKPGLSVNELADHLRIPQQSASRHVAVLTGRYQGDLGDGPLEPLIVQQINEADPRKRALYLTDAGGQLVARLLNSASPKA